MPPITDIRALALPMNVHTLPIQVRYADTDALGHVNNAVYNTYAELARIAFFGEVGVDVSNLILARVAVDYRRQLRFGDSPTVMESWVTKIGRTSLGVAHRLLVDGQIAADIETVVVHFDYGTNAPAPVPDGARELLRPYLQPAG